MTEAKLFAAKFKQYKKEHRAWVLLGENDKELIAKWFGFGYAAKKAPKKLKCFVYRYYYSNTVVIRANTREEADILFSAYCDYDDDPEVDEALDILGDNND